MTNFRKMLSGYVILIRNIRKNNLIKRNFERTLLIEPFRLLVHPIATFNDVKFERRGSLLIANVLMLLYLFQQAFAVATGGYLFNPEAGKNFSLLLILGETAGIALMWTVCNWAMCTLTDGEGKVREIWMAVCYSLLPAILLGFIGIAVSNALSLDENMIYATLQFIAIGWTLLLVFLGMMVVHQYSVTKTLLSVFFTLLCMAATAFLLLLFFSVFQQIVGFVSGLWQEISYR